MNNHRHILERLAPKSPDQFCKLVEENKDKGLSIKQIVDLIYPKCAAMCETQEQQAELDYIKRLYLIEAIWANQLQFPALKDVMAKYDIDERNLFADYLVRTDAFTKVRAAFNQYMNVPQSSFEYDIPDDKLQAAINFLVKQFSPYAEQFAKLNALGVNNLV